MAQLRKMSRCLQRPAWSEEGRLYAFKHKHTTDKRGRPKIIYNYYEKTKGLD